MRLLLKKKELFHEAGPGVSLLLSINLKEILLRWISFMIELATVKLNKLIDILEKEVKIRRYFKREMKNRNKYNVVSVIDEEDTSSSEDEDENEENKNSKSSKEKGHQMLNLVGGANKARVSIAMGDPSIQKDKYIPFNSYNKDLERLQTFRTMISKVVTELGKYKKFNQLGTHLITDGVLLAIGFAIDLSERKLQLSNIEFVNKVIQMSNQPA